MTDEQIIIALADSLPAREIAWKVERPLSYVLRVLVNQTRRYGRRISRQDIAMASGGEAFTVYRLADALGCGADTLRTRLNDMEKSGQVKRVGKIDRKTLWMIEVE